MTATLWTAGHAELDRAAAARDRFWASATARARELISPELIEEHRRRPIGQHGDRLARLLTHLRTIPGIAHLVILALPDGSFALGGLDRERGRSPAPVNERRFATIDEAEHAVFTLRLKALEGREQGMPR